MDKNNQNPLKVAIVDVQWVVNHVPAVQALRQEHQNKSVALKQWVDSVNAEIAKQSNDDSKKELVQKYQLEFSQKQQSLNQEHMQKVQSIDADITKLVSDVAAKEGYNYVFAKGTVLFGGTDITQKIVDQIK